jgi:hypothetical protein
MPWTRPLGGLAQSALSLLIDVTECLCGIKSSAIGGQLSFPAWTGRLSLGFPETTCSTIFADGRLRPKKISLTQLLEGCSFELTR